MNGSPAHLLGINTETIKIQGWAGEIRISSLLIS